MNINQMALLELIKYSQFANDRIIVSNNIDWDEVYREAEAHSVLGLVAYEVPCAFMNDNWRQIQSQQQKKYFQKCIVECQLSNHLSSNSIPYKVIDGNALAINYRVPSRRAIKNIKLCVSPKTFDFAKDILLSSGYELNEGNEGGYASLGRGGFDIELWDIRGGYYGYYKYKHQN